MPTPFVVTNNPYQSPAADDFTESVGRTMAPFRLVGVGVFAGAILGSTCGAVHAAAIATTIVLLEVFGIVPILPVDSMLESISVFLLAATIAGAVVGLPIGLVIGFIMGVLAGVGGPQTRRPFYVFGITIATFSSAIASGVLAINPLQSPQAVFVLTAITLTSGTLTGFIGGLCLVRGLAKLAWTRPSGPG